MSTVPDHAQFSAHLETTFELRHEELGEFAFELVQVSDLRTTHHQEMFSIVFAAPPGVHLPQRTYTLAHADLGEVSLFLVPVGLRDDRVLYEAVFNRLVE